MIDNSMINNRYRMLMGTNDMIAISTPGRVRKSVNKAYCTFFGKSEEELVGTSFTDDFPEEKKKFYWEFISQMTPDNPSIFTVQKTHGKDGESWVNWTENGIYDEQGNLTEVLSIGRNVDEMITTRTQRNEVSHLLSAYLDAIDTNIISSVTNRQGIITHANNHFCRVSQYSQAELIGKSHNIVNSQYHSKEFFADMWQTILAGKMWQGEIRNRAKDGSIYWVKTVIVPVRTDKMEIDSFLSLRILITERKLLEEEKNNYLQSLEEMLFMVSHELRKPITSCMGVLDLMQHTDVEKEEFKGMVNYMVQSAKELDAYSRKLNDYIQTHSRFSGRMREISGT